MHSESHDTRQGEHRPSYSIVSAQAFFQRRTKSQVHQADHIRDLTGHILDATIFKQVRNAMRRTTFLLKSLLPNGVLGMKLKYTAYEDLEL